MRLFKDIQWVMSTGVMLVIAGCSISYNGAWRGSQGDRMQIAEYQRKIAEIREQRKLMQTGKASPASSEPPSQTKIEFEPTIPDPTGPVSKSTFASYDKNANRRSMGLLGLYGQFASRGAERSSPLDSGETIRQVTFTSEGGDTDPEIDPTGTFMVYASTRHRHTSDLYMTRIGNSAVTQLTSDPGNEVMPTFSHDGSRIAFASDRAGNWDIYMMQVSGGQAVQITNDLSHQIHPSFSPDGRQLVYSSFGQQSGQWELVLVDVDNPTTKRFIGFGIFPTWSPVDNRIAFQRARERGTRWFSVWTVEVVNGEATRPTEIAASSNAAAITPCWSPDARSIVFCTVVHPDTEASSLPQQSDIWLTSSTGQGRMNLTNSKFANFQPVWSRDGTIFFVSDRAKNGVENVWSIRPDRALKLASPAMHGGPTVMVRPSAVRPSWMHTHLTETTPKLGIGTGKPSALPSPASNGPVVVPTPSNASGLGPAPESGGPTDGLMIGTSPQLGALDELPAVQVGATIP